MLLFAFLFAGCAEQYTHQESVHYTNDLQTGSSAKQPEKYDEEGITVTEPEGILTLREVLALTLMHNPELKAFSLEIRAAQARQLQAGLKPNPEIEIEVEEVAGSGDRSGFDAAETVIQLSQLIELGDKSGKRKKVASFEKDLAGIDYQNKRLKIFRQNL